MEAIDLAVNSLYCKCLKPAARCPWCTPLFPRTRRGRCNMMVSDGYACSPQRIRCWRACWWRHDMLTYVEEGNVPDACACPGGNMCMLQLKCDQTSELAWLCTCRLYCIQRVLYQCHVFVHQKPDISKFLCCLNPMQFRTYSEWYGGFKTIQLICILFKL